jgi:hopene-associated glycosyltransferase HpnB
MTWSAGFGLLALAIWLYLLAGRGSFWLARERDDRDDSPTNPSTWPRVTAVVPARNEADVIAESIVSLLRQDYPGDFRIVLVDDGSDDDTATRAMASAGGDDRLEVLHGSPVPTGWTGKLWALHQGVQHATMSDAWPDYLLLTDADIGHAPENLRSLVARAESRDVVLISLMAELSCRGWAERFLIPAFVFFFQMLYPFAWVADRNRTLAAAAGGCMLVRHDALAAMGGIASIRSEIIDDCALARRLKLLGPIRLDLTRRVVSLRSYARLSDIGRMVSRSAYAQLEYSPLLLTGTVAGMVLTYLAPAMLALFGSGIGQAAGLAAWLLMTVAFQPMLRFYRVSPLWGIALPAIAGAYTIFTVQSAMAVWRGRGGTWKGRVQARMSQS